MKDDFELTPEEKMALEKLPREAEPSRILEERIVRSLREEGVLGRRDGGGGRDVAPKRQGTWIRPWMVAGSVAASLVLFASGVLLGHRMGAESTAQAFIAVRDQDAAQLASRIQEAGSAYVSALAALSDLRPDGAAGGDRGVDLPGGGSLQLASDLQQGNEVAFGALYGAAYELARLNPDDADVLRVVQILEERRERERGQPAAERNVVWF
jgi:hypothetical protein